MKVILGHTHEQVVEELKKQVNGFTEQPRVVEDTRRAYNSGLVLAQASFCGTFFPKWLITEVNQQADNFTVWLKKQSYITNWPRGYWLHGGKVTAIDTLGQLDYEASAEDVINYVARYYQNSPFKYNKCAYGGTGSDDKAFIVEREIPVDSFYVVFGDDKVRYFSNSNYFRGILPTFTEARNSITVSDHGIYLPELFTDVSNLGELYEKLQPLGEVYFGWVRAWVQLLQDCALQAEMTVPAVIAATDEVVSGWYNQTKTNFLRVFLNENSPNYDHKAIEAWFAEIFTELNFRDVLVWLLGLRLVDLEDLIFQLILRDALRNVTTYEADGAKLLRNDSFYYCGVDEYIVGGLFTTKVIPRAKYFGNTTPVTVYK